MEILYVNISSQNYNEHECLHNTYSYFTLLLIIAFLSVSVLHYSNNGYRALPGFQLKAIKEDIFF